MVLFPNTEIPQKDKFFSHGTAGRAFTKDEITRIRNGDLKLYALGEIKYEDAFGKAQWATFCAEIRANTQTLKSLTSNYPQEDLKVEFSIAPSGNDASK